jgi:hypothetical protein
MKRSPNSAAPPSQRALWNLFREVRDLGLGYSLPAEDSDHPESLRPEIRSGRARWFGESLVNAPSKDIYVKPENDSKSITFKADPRKVGPLWSRVRCCFGTHHALFVYHRFG